MYLEPELRLRSEVTGSMDDIYKLIFLIVTIFLLLVLVSHEER